MSENTSDGRPDGADEPTADDAPDRTLSWWPLLAAVVVGAVFLTIIFTVGTDGDSGPGTERDDNGALTCPSSYQRRNHKPWVPADASGVDGKKGLVPNAGPSHVTLCSYTTSNTTTRTALPVELSRHYELTDGTRAMARDLSRAKKPTKSDRTFGTVEPPTRMYLIGMTFATGFVWVSVTDASATTNGQFSSGSTYFNQVFRAFQRRSWS